MVTVIATDLHVYIHKLDSSTIIDLEIHPLFSDISVDFFYLWVYVYVSLF